MTTLAITPLAQRARAGFSIVATVATAVALVSGCGGGSSTAQGPVVTVTTTPTVTAGIPSPAARTTRVGLKSDDIGRKFDLGTIVKVEDDGGVAVLIFDRWSARGVPDAKLATSGVPIRVHADAPYANVNTRNTFRVPVVKGAIFTYNHCISVGQPAQQRSSTLQEFATLKAPEKVMLLTLDPQGHVFKAENDPAC